MRVMLAKAGSADPGRHDTRYVVLIMDGAAGWPLAELGGRTCLAAADTPNLDWIASRGTVGTAATVPAGMEPSSAAACMSIIGYDPRSYQMGRGAIEAASLDIEMGPDDVAFRCNLVTVIDGVMADYSAGHIPSSQSHEIVRRLKAVLDSDEVTLYPGLSYRHILKVSGHPDWADAVCTPPHDIHGKPVGDHTPKGPGAEALSMLMSESVEALAHDPLNRERLASGASPATTIWPFWPGKPPAHAPRFDELRQVRAALTSPVDLLNGLARIFSIDRLAIHGVTDGDDNDYAGQMEGALAALDDHDLVFVHVESPDEAAHAGDVSRKIAAIERIDRDMVLRLIEHSSRCPLRVLVLPDHPTPIELRTHIGEPVPFVAFGPGIAAGGSTGLDELTAAGSGLRFEATELLDRLIRADFA
jgi:2,3-bisphosphoglycerate-independent phosphoglycerate mutase